MHQIVRESNKLDTSIFQAPSYSVFHKALLDFIRPTANSTFGTNDVSSLKLLTRLRVGFSHLREHKFKRNFQNTLNPLCPCSLEAEDASENEIVQVLLFGNIGFSKDMNFRIITSSICFIKDSKRFDESLSS